MVLRKGTLLIIVGLLACGTAWPLGSVEIKDTYFARFFDHSIIQGSSAPGKYSLDFNSGKENLTTGFLLDFPPGFLKGISSHMSQSGGFFIYKFSDSLNKASTDGDTLKTVSLTGLNLCYGWNIYQLPLRTNLYAGINLQRLEEKRTFASASDTSIATFAPTPYFYFNNPWSSTFRTRFDFMLGHTYKELAKLALQMIVIRKGWDLGFHTERNGSEFNDSYENSFSLTKKFGSRWFFANIVGMFWDDMKQLKGTVDQETEEAFAMVDNMFGGTTGILRLKFGSSFDVNNLAGETFGDKAGEAGNYFGKAEFGYILLVGLSYKVEEKLGFRFGFNYGLNLDALKGTESGQVVEDSKEEGLFSLQGKTVSVALEYLYNYVNDDMFGMRIDPGMFHIKLAIR